MLTTTEEQAGNIMDSLQSVAGLTHLELSINLTPLPSCLWTVGGSQNTQREPSQTRGEHENSTQKGPARWWN